jgi:hypothetical protein
MDIPFKAKANDCHITVFLCDSCADIHVAMYAPDETLRGQALIRRDDLNAVIVEMMKIRDQLNLKED